MLPADRGISAANSNPLEGKSDASTGVQTSQPAQPTYTFNGQTYKTKKQAEAARQSYIQNASANADLIARANADLAMVGYDFNKYSALRDSGGLLSQMTDAERSFITKRYQATNPYERKEYTNSAVDQYLSSVGMPAYKELNTYRKAYYDYASGGGVFDNFPGLDDDTYRYINKHWQDGMQTGVDGKLYTAKGKEVQYKDTLLDDQLKSAGLPPASMINDYFLDYQQDKQIDTDIKDFYAAVYEKTRDGMPGEEAYRTTLAEPKYLPLSQYVSEAVVYPNEADYTDNDVLSDTYGQTDKAKFDTAWNKALTADAKREALEHRVSYDDYKAYSARQNETRRWEQLEEQHTTAKQNAAKWFTTPAASDAEKEQRATEMKQYFSVFEPNASMSDMQTYFSLLDAGVPYETILRGPASITAWNESSNASSPTYADVKLLSQGYSADDGDYAANKEIVRQTKDWTKRSGYESSSLYRDDLYEKETYAVGRHALRVSPEGAVYAEVNGITGDNHALVEYADSPEYALYAAVSSADSSGKRLCDYMTDEERGVFNSMYQYTPARAMEYLNGLSDMLEDRRYVDSTGTFAARLATDGVNMSEGEIADHIYDALLYEQGQALEDVNPEKDDAWHLDAWKAYANYPNEMLQQIAAESDIDPLLHGPNEAQWVLDTRQQLRTRANVEASLYGYTDEAGKAATAEHDYSADIVPKAPDEKETSFAEQFARSSMGGLDWSSTIEHVRDGGYAHDVEQPIFDQMSESQRDQYNWLYKNKGAEAAQAFYQLIRPSLAEAAAEGIRAERKAYGKENKITASLASVPGTFLSGMTGLVGSALNLATGTELTESQAASWNFSNQWREGVSEDWSPLGQFAYGTVMSMADSTITALMAAAGMPAGAAMGGGLVADFATAWMASSAYTATLDSAMARGLDPSQAYGTALVAGIAEFVTEKISLDSLLEGVGEVSKSGKGALTKAYFTNVAKQAFVEGTEEVNSDIINFLWDNLVNGDKSEFNQHVNSLVDSGYTRDEAQRIAWKQQIIDTSLSFAGGVLSGGLMGAGSGGFGVRAALYDYAFGAEGAQADTPASAPAQTGASVRVHADAYARGRSVVDQLFGQTVGNNALYALDNKESESTAKRIDAISEGITKLDNTSYLYGYTHDAEGNLTLTDDQRVALASVLALAYEDANADNMDSAFIHAMASLQTEQQRAANTNYGWIKNAQDVRNVIDQIAKTREAINTIETEQQTKLADAQAAYSAAAAEVAAITKRQQAATSIKEKASLQATLKTAQDKADNLKARLNTIETTDASNAKAQVKAASEEISRQQTLLDRHYASSSAFLSEYAPAAFDGATAARASATSRRNDVGAKIDAIIASDMSDSEKQGALAPLRQQQASAVGSLHAIDTRLANADPAALSNAMNTMKSNTVSDYIKAQSEAAQKATGTAQTSDTEESSTTGENGKNNAAESVKRDDAKKSAAKNKAKVAIGPKVQQTFNRIAKKFGCEIVWGDDSTAIGNTGQTLAGRNGAYDKSDPNKIYLNKTMVAGKGMSSTQAVAREFFTHEVTHYVANTKTFRSIMAKAARYYNTEYKGRGGVDALVNAMIEDEQRRGNKGFGRAQALEEMTAHFVQEVLFADESGTRRALVWLARSDSNMVNNFLNMVEYLIKRGNVRKASDGNTVKTMLIDAEFELINALQERQYLDRNGKTSAFQRSSNTQAQAAGDVANARQGMNTDDYLQGTVDNTVGADAFEQVPDERKAQMTNANSNTVFASSREEISQNVSAALNGKEQTNVEIGVLPYDFVQKINESVPNLPKELRDGVLRSDRQYVIEVSYDAIRHLRNHHGFNDEQITNYILRLPAILRDFDSVYYSRFEKHGIKQDGLRFKKSFNGRNEVAYEMVSKKRNVLQLKTDFNEKMELNDPAKSQSRSGSTSETSGISAPMDNMPQGSVSVNHKNMGTPIETVSDVRDIFTGKGEGHSGVMNSRGMTTDEYMALDFSKNKLLQKNGKPYKELYSGSPYAGFTIFNTGYADDGLSNFATSSKLIAQSYTNEGEMAPEYDPRNADRDREQMDKKGWYMKVEDAGRYGKKANNTLSGMLNQVADWVFSQDKEDMQYLDLAAQNIEDDDLRQVAVQGIEAGALINYAVSRMASHHSASDFAEVQNAYQIIVQANERLMPAAKAELDRVRKIYSEEDFRFDSENPPQDTPLLAASSYLRTLQTGIEDALLNSGIYDVLKQADLGVDPDEKMYVGFDSLYKGKARLFSEQETWDLLPTYDGEPGYYKLKVYAENPLDVDVNDQNWVAMDVASFPSDVREKLANLYGYKLSYKTREVSRAAYETGYDAVVFRGLHDTNDMDLDEPSDVIITYKPYQSKSVYNENPTTNPDIMFSTGMSIDDYIQRYGQKEQNAFGRANNILTPDYVDNDAGRRFRVSDTAQTLKEVPHIRQSVRNMIDDGILQQADGLLERHGLVYDPVSLDRMRELGTQYIADHGGLTQAMRDLTRDMPIARNNQLVQYMSAANQVFTEIGAEGTFDPQEYYEFVTSYVEMRSTWGRVGRVMQLVNDSPLGRVTYWQRVVDRLNEANQAAVQRGLNPLFYRNGADAIVVPQSFYDALAQAQTQEEIDAAEYAITQYIGQNSPLTVGDALRNWRYFAMLANPVTHMRNLLGNLTMLGGRIAKDTIASGMEDLAVRRGRMSADERTHAVTLGQDADTRDFVRQLWEDNADAVQSGGRDGFKQDLQEATPKSPIRVIDRLMRWNGNMLEREDRIFLGATFRAAAAQYIQAQGLDVHNLTREQRGAIVNYATQQAQEATYRDASRLADALNQFAKSGWASQLFVDAVIPFKKTPINIFKRGIEYSPAGIARGLIDIARNATAQNRGGQPVVSASVIVDELAKGLTGSMLALLGFFLAKAGVLKVSAGEDDKDKAFEKDIGRQDYSLEIGDLSIKIESLAPLTFPLFMGAQLQRFTNTEHDGLSLSDLTDAASTLADPLMDMSFMSSLNSVLSTYNENKIGGVVTNAAEAYLGQYLPTIGSKFNQTINANRRTSKASQASPVGTNMDYWLRSMASKVPGVNQAVLEPYVKTTGEYDAKDSFGDYILSFMNNFVSPVNVQIIDTTPVNRELSRLVSATGATDFVPQNPKKYLNIGNERYNMTAKEYTQYSKEHNETVYAVLSQVIQSDAYARATDDQRSEMLKKAYDRAHRTVMDKYKAVFAQK